MDDPTSGSRTLRHTSQAGESSLDHQKISAMTSPQASGHWLQYPWLLCVGHDWAEDKTLVHIKEKRKARITATFTNLNKETVEKTRDSEDI